MFKIVEFSHYLITEHYKRLNRNDLIFVDATCGMGNDSLFMAETLNHTGHLVCYDIQDVAISTTKELLTSHNYLNVEYKQMSHEFISEIADLIIYNCGYLPGHDKSLTTKASSTLASVKKALSIMAVNTNLLIIIVLSVFYLFIISKCISNFFVCQAFCIFVVCKIKFFFYFCIWFANVRFAH